MVIPKKFLTISLAVIIIAVAGYFLILNRGSVKTSQNADGTAASASETSGPSDQNPQERAEAAPIPVKAVPARRGDLVISLKSPGEAYTGMQIAIKAEVEGVVKNLYAAEGRHVKENEILLELDDLPFRLDLEKTDALRLKALSDLFVEKSFAPPEDKPNPALMAKLKEKEAAYKKAAEAFRQGALSPEDFDQAQKDYELAMIEAGAKRDEIMAATKGVTQAEVDAKTAKLRLAKTVIRAPFAGIITDLKISPREHIDPGRELFTLVNISRIRVKARVLESEIGKMKVGRSVDLRFSAYPGKVFKGTVEAIAPIVNSEDKTCAVHIAVNNPTEEIKPGMHAEVEIAAEVYRERLLVPQAAILVRGGRKLVFVVEGDLAKWRYVTVGLESEDFAEILPSDRPEEMVKEGDLVITEGHFTLAHDAHVVVRD
jgi:RND family efflux transporter MFP subunit